MSKSVALSSTAIKAVQDAEKAVENFFEAGTTFDVVKFIAAFNGLNQADSTARNEAAAARVQWAMEFIDRVDGNEEFQKSFIYEREQREVRKPQRDGNPYPQYIRVLFGKWVVVPAKAPDGKPTRVWEPNSSAFKYAQVIREARRLGWATSEVKEKILAHRNVDGTPGITGLVEDDTRANSGEPDPDKGRNNEPKWKGDTKNEALKAEGLCELELPPEVQKELAWIDGFCNVTLVRKNGKVKLLCDAKDDAKRVVKTVHDRKDDWKKTAA